MLSMNMNWHCSYKFLNEKPVSPITKVNLYYKNR